jgi:hypothetical protein
MCPIARWPRRRARAMPREAAEMIQTNYVDVAQQRAQTIYPPAIAGLAKSIPVVNGIAPELPRRAEIVRRHAGDEARPAPFVEKKQFRVGPDVARIGRDEEWQVADQLQALAVRVCLEPLGLAEEQELYEARQSDLIGQFAARTVERRRLALDQLTGHSR